MSGAVSRGGAAVGRLSDLGPVEAGAVVILRHWSDMALVGNGDHALERAETVGDDPSVSAALTQICMLCARYGRRPLVRHGAGCACLGADESCFAHMVAAASDGAREDALMMASLIVRPDFAPALVALSEQLGLALRRVSGTGFGIRPDRVEQSGLLH